MQLFIEKGHGAVEAKETGWSHLDTDFKGFDLEKLDSPDLSHQVFEEDDGNPISSRWDKHPEN